MEALQEAGYQRIRTFSLGATELWEAEILKCMVQEGSGSSTAPKHLVLYLCGFFVTRQMPQPLLRDLSQVTWNVPFAQVLKY